MLLHMQHIPNLSEFFIQMIKEGDFGWFYSFYKLKWKQKLMVKLLHMITDSVTGWTRVCAPAETLLTFFFPDRTNCLWHTVTQLGEKLSPIFQKSEEQHLPLAIQLLKQWVYSAHHRWKSGAKCLIGRKQSRLFLFSLAAAMGSDPAARTTCNRGQPCSGSQLSRPHHSTQKANESHQQLK